MAGAPSRQVCALLRDGRVLTDPDGRLPAYDDRDRQASLHRRAETCGDTTAVLIAPQLLVRDEPTVLLSVFGARTGATHEPRGAWTPVGEVAEDEDLVTALRDVQGVAEGNAPPPPGRPDWFARTWYDDVDLWVDTELAARGRRRNGRTRPAKVWSLSAVLEIPCDPAPVWFKASCPHFHAEPALTRLIAQIAPEHAPPVVAVDEARAWLLMEDMSGADELNEDDPPPGLGLAAARIAATLHRRSLDHLAAIEAAGVPRRGLAGTARAFDEVLENSVELDDLSVAELAAARGCRDRVHQLIGELVECGFPETLVHGDLHTGNVAHDGDALVVYDWSDAAVSHPLLDLVLLTAPLPEAEREAARAAYLGEWRRTVPNLDDARVILLAEHVNAVYQMVSYEQIYRSQEKASSWDMRGVVARGLRRLPGRLANA